MKKIFLGFLLCFVMLCLSSAVSATEQVELSVGRILAEQGDSVLVPITLDSNPGLAFLRLNISYDSSRLAITGTASAVRGTALAGLSYIGVNEDTYRRNPFRVMWYGTLVSNDRSVGTLLSIEFAVLSDAPAGEAYVYVTVDEEDSLGQGGVAVAVSTTAGGVIIIGDDSDVEQEQPPVTPTPTPATPPELPVTPPIEPTPTPPPHSPDEPETNAAQPPVAPPPTPRPPRTPSAVSPIAATPRQVDMVELPQNIRDIAYDFPVYIVEIPGEEQTRVLMSAPFTRNPDTLPETLVAYSISVDGTVDLVIPSLYDEVQSAVKLLGYTNRLYMVAPNFVEFADVLGGGWYFNAVAFVAARELFSGIGNNLFAPQSTMTRGMFVAVLARLDGADISLYTDSPFYDVTITQWYGQAIAWAANAGIVGASNVFRPAASITREEMALIFANYLAIRDFPLVESAVYEFYDLNLASPAMRDAIQTMRRYSIIVGIGDNLYNPQGEATRAEVSQIFTNLVRAIVGLS